MENEVVRAIQKYFCQCDSVINYYGQIGNIEVAINTFLHGERYCGDAPDMVVIHDNVVLVCEHFEFDCFMNNRKGSQHRKEVARIEREFKENSKDKKQYYRRDTIKGDSSYELYLKNLISAFENHYKKIDSYIEHLKNETIINEKSIVKTMFIIEDVSPLGSMCYNLNGGWTEREQPIIPVLSKEFLSICKEATKLDFILSLSDYSNNKFRWILSKDSIDDYVDKSIKYSELKFINFKPQVVGFNLIVTKEELE